MVGDQHGGIDNLESKRYNFEIKDDNIIDFILTLEYVLISSNVTNAFSKV